MTTLKRYLRILNRLNYTTSELLINTQEVLHKNMPSNVFKEYYSRLTLSLDPPIGKGICVSCSGRNILKDLAEQEAIKNAINYICMYCLKNGICNLNEETSRNPALKKNYIQSNQSAQSNCLMKELPFFNQECIVLNNNNINNVVWWRNVNSTHDYQKTSPYIGSIRNYSTQSSFSSVDGSSVGSAPVLKVKNDVSDTTETYSAFNKDHAEACKNFPQPKNFIGNLYDVIRKSLRSDRPLKSFSTKMTPEKEWIYTLQVFWPDNAIFNGIGSTKKEAGRRAAILCIEWLRKLGKIDQKGRLKTLDKKTLEVEIRKPLAEIKIDNSFIVEAEELIKCYSDANLEEKLKQQKEEWENNNLELCPDFSGKEGFSGRTISENLSMKRSSELYSRLQERKRAPDKNIERLPISMYRNQIADLIEKNQVLVIKGEPGCGKSTQVPQIIMDYFTEKLKAAYCNIVVTQPRRISAISLAERVASERHEMVGDVVGYQVRLHSMKPHRERGILFCSTGIMLRRLLSDPDMNGITHLIIDEAHERDLNTDFMLLLTKRAAKKNPNLKIIIMSATINPELFQNYFNNSESLLIPGFTHPVTEHFLDLELARITRINEKNINSDFPRVDINAIVRLVLWINSNKPPGAILVFLPGWAEIRKLLTELTNCVVKDNLLVLPVHSRLSHTDQKKIFCSPPDRIRKVILATNIAETSITIDDVNYVIDSGAHKEERLNSHSGMLAIDNQWISQASARQRKGRAGRVRPGECFHLYTKEKYNSFDQFPLPEVHRVRLETSVLNSKVYSGNEKAEEFLNQLPEPPKKEMIRDAVEKLQWAGALDDDENLTPLGTRISVFTTHPLISKALVHAHMFKCVTPLVTIGTILSSDVELFPGTMGDKTRIRAEKIKLDPFSDHIALSRLFHQWEQYNEGSDAGYNIQARRFAESMQASHEALSLIGKIRHLVGGHLYQCGLLDRPDDYKNAYSDCNMYAKNNELVKGVLLSGLGNILSIRNWDYQKGVLKNKNVVLTESGQRATVSSESVNNKRSEFPSPFMTYFTEVRSEQQRSVIVRETSIISPLTFVLFQCATLTINKKKDKMSNNEDKLSEVIISLVSGKRTLNVQCDEKTAIAVVKLRRIVWSIVGYLVREEGNPLDAKLYSEVLGYHEKLLLLLNKILNEQADLMSKKANNHSNNHNNEDALRKSYDSQFMD